MLSLLGAAEKIPAKVEGADLSGHLKSGGKKAIERKDPFFSLQVFQTPTASRHRNRSTGIQTNQGSRHRGILSLNLKTDIGESKDLSGEQPELARQLNQKMTEYFARFGWDESKIKSHDKSKSKKRSKGADACQTTE